MAEQQAIARELAASAVGRTLRVLVEGPVEPGGNAPASVFSWEHGLIRDGVPSEVVISPAGGGRKGAGRVWVARGEADAPDIDGRVYVRGKMAPGEFAEVRVVGATDYDLIAEPSRR